MNDRITKIAVDLGYCCPFAMFKDKEGPRDTHNRVADKLGLSYSTIRFNRRRIRNGELICSNLANCQCKGEGKDG